MSQTPSLPPLRDRPSIRLEFALRRAAVRRPAWRMLRRTPWVAAGLVALPLFALGIAIPSMAADFESGIPPTVTAAESTAPRGAASGEGLDARDRRALAALLSEMQAVIQRQYREAYATLDSLELGELSDASFFISAANRAEGERRMLVYERFLDRQLEFSDELKRLLTERAEATLSPARRRGLYEGMDQAKAMTDQLNRETAAAHRAFIESTRAIYRFVTERQGRLAVKDGELVVRSQADVDAFNALVERQSTAAAQAQRLQTEAAARNAEGMQKLRAAAARLVQK